MSEYYPSSKQVDHAGRFERFTVFRCSTFLRQCRRPTEEILLPHPSRPPTIESLRPQRHRLPTIKPSSHYPLALPPSCRWTSLSASPSLISSPTPTEFLTTLEIQNSFATRRALQ